MGEHKLKEALRTAYDLFFYRRRVLPEVKAQLGRWLARARAIPSLELRRQAEASIRAKRFHCEGGSVFSAALQDKRRFKQVAELIVAFQTISDYLDNLCDRTTSKAAEDFQQLHLALQDAVSDAALHGNYYRFHPHKEDGGYLEELVVACRQTTKRLPSYPVVADEALRFAKLYSDMQTYKHLLPGEREESCRRWFSSFSAEYPGLEWQEFCAAAGSTLIHFALFAMATSPALDAADVQRLVRAYFPAITALHIMLDYLIDRDEDRRFDDLNFVAQYGEERRAIERLRFFITEGLRKSRTLPDARFHELLVKGLVVFYLYKEKQAGGGREELRRELMSAARIGRPMRRLLELMSRAP